MTQPLDLAHLIPMDWLQQKKGEYLILIEKITFTLIRIAAAKVKWKHPLTSSVEYTAFFEAEAARLQKKLPEIKAWFHQAASIKAKEQVFEKHFAQLIPRDAAGNPLIPRAQIAKFVHQSHLQG